MNQKILSLFCFFCGLICFSQGIAVNYSGHLNQRLFDVGEKNLKYELLSDLQLQADSEDSYYLNLLGLMHREGLGVEKNEDKAFELVLKAAEKDLPAAQFNIGRFYMIGVGCEIDFDKAIYWMSKSSNNGNERASYALGYMCFKGFGVKQDYKQAVSWFKLSSWPMASHYLGICSYFGYGVERNEDQAILYFSKSGTPNSDMLLKHISENVKESMEKYIAKEISEKATQSNTVIEKVAIEKTADFIEEAKNYKDKKELKTQYLNGKWKGKLIELDWSGKEIVNILPLSCEFKAKDNAVGYKWDVKGKLTEDTAFFEDNALYFEKQFMTLELPYYENPNSNLITWQILSSDLEFKTINKKTYLIGSLSTFSSEWKESGPPMHIILKQTQQDDDDLTKDEMLELSQGKDHFITLYPNPFESNVLIEYELKAESNVNVGVYDLSGNAAVLTLTQEDLQSQGTHRYTINGSELRPGMYIVRVAAGNIVHSRILIKN